MSLTTTQHSALGDLWSRGSLQASPTAFSPDGKRTYSTRTLRALVEQGFARWTSYDSIAPVEQSFCLVDHDGDFWAYFEGRGWSPVAIRGYAFTDDVPVTDRTHFPNFEDWTKFSEIKDEQTPSRRGYTIGLPVTVWVSSDGTVEWEIDHSEAAREIERDDFTEHDDEAVGVDAERVRAWVTRHYSAAPGWEK